VARAFPDAWIEDPAITPETSAVLEPHIRRVTWDAPLRSAAASASSHQIQYLASLFHPDTPNDVAPSGYNRPKLDPGLPTSPLTEVPADVGFRWA
jgi:hypothetical protein